MTDRTPRPLTEPEWMGLNSLGEYEVEVDIRAAPGTPEAKCYRFRPRAYSGEPEPQWLPGRPPKT